MILRHFPISNPLMSSQQITGVNQHSFPSVSLFPTAHKILIRALAGKKEIILLKQKMRPPLLCVARNHHVRSGYAHYILHLTIPPMVVLVWLSTCTVLACPRPCEAVRVLTMQQMDLVFYLFLTGVREVTGPSDTSTANERETCRQEKMQLDYEVSQPVFREIKQQTVPHIYTENMFVCEYLSIGIM